MYTLFRIAVVLYKFFANFIYLIIFFKAVVLIPITLDTPGNVYSPRKNFCTHAFLIDLDALTVGISFLFSHFFLVWTCICISKLRVM